MKGKGKGKGKGKDVGPVLASWVVVSTSRWLVVLSTALSKALPTYHCPLLRRVRHKRNLLGYFLRSLLLLMMPLLP